MKSLNQLVCLMAVLAALACTVYAQDAEESQGDRFRFSVSARVDATDNRDAWESDKEANVDVYLQPRMDLLMESEATLVNLFYVPAFRYRSNPSEIQNDTELQHDFGVTLKHRPSRRTRFGVSEKFTLTDDPSITEGVSTVRGDRSYYVNTARGTIDHMVSRKNEVQLYAGNQIKRYDEEDMSERWDEDRTDAGGKLVRHMTQMTRLTVEGRYTVYGYQSPGMITRDFDSVLLAGGLEKSLTKNLAVGGQVGAQKQTYDDDGIDVSTSQFVELFVKGNTTPALRLSGTLTHAVRDADAYPFASQEYTQVRGVADWDTTAKTTLTLSGLYRLGKYEDVVPSAAPLVSLFGAPDGDEATIDVYGQFAFKVSDQMTVLLRQRFQDVDSDVWVSYTKNTTTLELTKYF